MADAAPYGKQPEDTAPAGDMRQMLADLAADRTTAGTIVGRADVRSSALLGVSGLTLGAAITILVGRTSRSGWDIAALAFAWTGTLLLTGAVILLILAVRPVLSEFVPLHGWTLQKEQPVRLGSGIQVERIQRNLAYIEFLTTLIQRKHTLMKHAADLLLLAIPAFILGAVLWAVSG